MSDSLFTISASVAFFAMANSFVKIGVRFRKFMTVNTVRLMLMLISNSTSIINLCCHWLKMKRIATDGRSAKVIDVQSFGNFAEKKFIQKAVNLPCSCSTVDIIRTTAPCPSPQPTARVWFDTDFVSNTLRQSIEI